MKPKRKQISAWRGVRMRQVLAAPDPDAPLRQVTLAASWDDVAASGLAELAPGNAPTTLTEAADRWIAPLATAATLAGLEPTLNPDQLHRLLPQKPCNDELLDFGRSGHNSGEGECRIGADSHCNFEPPVLAAGHTDRG